MSTTPPPPNGPAEPLGPAGYPVHPGTPSQQPRAADVPQPGPVQLAVRLMWAGAAVSLLSLIVGLAMLGSMKDDIREQLLKEDPNASQSTIDAAYAVGIVFVVFVGAIGVLLWLWMAWKNGQGRSWARIVATVLGGLNVLFTLAAFAAQSAEPANLAFSLINLVLAIIIVVLLWRKESTEFYVARSRPQYG